MVGLSPLSRLSNGGKEWPSAEGLEKVLGSVGMEVEDYKVSKKLAPVPSGGDVTASTAAAPAVDAAAPAVGDAPQ